MPRRLLGLAAVVLLLARPCAAQPVPPLQWRFEGTTYLDVRHIARQEISLLGRTRETETTVRFVFKVRPVKWDKEVVQLGVTVLATEDTTQVKGSPPERDTFKGFRGQEFDLATSPAGHMIGLQLPRGFTVAVFGDDAKNATEDERLFLTEMAEVILRLHLTDAFVPLPGKPADGAVPRLPGEPRAAGDGWRDTVEFKVQPLARMRVEREYVRAGPQIHDGKRVEVINWRSLVDLKPLAGKKGVLPFTVKELTPVAPPQNEGTALWDRAAGRPVRVDSVQTCEVDLVMEIDGKTVKGKGKVSDSFVIRLSATDPLAK